MNFSIFSFILLCFTSPSIAVVEDDLTRSLQLDGFRNNRIRQIEVELGKICSLESPRRLISRMTGNIFIDDVQEIRIKIRWNMPQGGPIIITENNVDKLASEFNDAEMRSTFKREPILFYQTRINPNPHKST